MKSRSENSSFIILKVLILLLLLVFFYLTPYTHDDWHWGSSEGMHELRTLFVNTNGRWAGNLLALLITRFRIVKAVILAVLTFSLLELMNRIVNEGKSILFFVAAALLFLAQKEVLSQGVIWSSAFVNYIPPIVLGLLVIYLNEDYFESSGGLKRNGSVYKAMLFLLMGFIGSLFIETFTVYNLILGVYLIVFGFIKYGKIILENAVYLLGCVLGAVLMFTNDIYKGLSTGSNSNGYYRISSFDLGAMFNTYSEGQRILFIQGNTVLVIVLALVIVGVMINSSVRSSALGIVKIICGVLILGYAMYVVYVNVWGGDSLFGEGTTPYREGLGSIIFLLAVLVAIIVSVEDSAVRHRMLLYFVSIAVLNGMLLFINPIGPRHFLHSYIFLIMIVLEAINYIDLDMSDVLKYIAALIAVTVIGFNILIFSQIYKVETLRNTYIENHLNDSTLTLPELPHSSYLWRSNPPDEYFRKRFKLYYSIPQTTNLEFIDYNEWKEKYGE